MGSDILEYPPAGEEGIARDRLWTRTSAGSMNLTERIQYPLKQWLFRREVARALKASDFVTGDNWVLVHAVRDWFGLPEHKSGLNRWGVEPDLFEISDQEEDDIRHKYRIEPGQTLLLSPRGIKPIYQGDIILDAMEQLLASGMYADTRMIMLSAGYAVPEKLDKQARRLEETYPQFSLVRTAIDREEMCRLWSLTDVFVSAPVYDGYSNALSEGRYIGALPVVNDTPATREVMADGKHGVVVRPFTADQLSRSMANILTQPKSWIIRVSKANREWVEREAILDVNIQRFIQQAEQLLQYSSGRSRNSS